jgi:Fic family protein
LQPLKQEDQRRLNQKFMLDFNYNSNHIEGNTLTYGQTKLLLIFGKTSGNAKFRDYEEMKAHNVGLEYMKSEAVDKKRALSEKFIRELNRVILVENYRDSQGVEIRIGNYKTNANSVTTLTGEIFEFASPQETPAFMTDLVNWYNEEEQKSELSPIELASLLHYRYIRIHPFEDGNGRIARLLVNYVLYRHNYPMIVIRGDKTHRDEYINILNECDVLSGLAPSDGAHATIAQIQPFVVYMETQLQRALEISIKTVKGESIEGIEEKMKDITI